jgi:hypothetical protein
VHLKGPYIYEISVESNSEYSVVGPSKESNFTAPVTQRRPKIYAFAHEGALIYIGQTVQGMSARMRLGFKANGTGGYWGYSWRNSLKNADLYVWCLEDVSDEEEVEALECIESEVVFLCRSRLGQWPGHQTEIHFHQTEPRHRNLAEEIFLNFNSVGA